MAKILAYADCSLIQVLSNKDPRLCDCNRIVDTDAIPTPDKTDKHKELSLKADWKYVGVHSFALVHGTNIKAVKAPRGNTPFIPDQYITGIFRPPRLS